MAKRKSKEAYQAANRINALKHGVMSNSPVIPDIEDDASWQRHLDGIKASIEPVGVLEEVLVWRVALITWRLFRLNRYEVASTMAYINRINEDMTRAAMYLAGPDTPELDPQEVAERRYSRVLPPNDDLDKIMRYEPSLHRQLVQTLHELQALQDRRNGLSAPLARVDFSGSPM